MSGLDLSAYDLDSRGRSGAERHRPPDMATVCPTWRGEPVTWAAWQRQRIFMCFRGKGAAQARRENVCDGCGRPWGVVLTMHGTTARPTDDPGPGIIRLTAQACPICAHLEMWTGAPILDPVSVIVCDGCDRACAAGPDETAARELLTARGGTPGSPRRDYDQCRDCTTTPPLPVAAEDAGRTGR